MRMNPEICRVKLIAPKQNQSRNKSKLKILGGSASPLSLLKNMRLVLERCLYFFNKTILRFGIYQTGCLCVSLTFYSRTEIGGISFYPFRPKAKCKTYDEIKVRVSRGRLLGVLCFHCPFYGLIDEFICGHSLAFRKIRYNSTLSFWYNNINPVIRLFVIPGGRFLLCFWVCQFPHLISKYGNYTGYLWKHSIIP